MKSENELLDNEQVKLIDQLAIVSSDITKAGGEMAELRHSCMQMDTCNLNAYKEIDLALLLRDEQKEISSRNF